MSLATLGPIQLHAAAGPLSISKNGDNLTILQKALFSTVLTTWESRFDTVTLWVGTGYIENICYAVLIANVTSGVLGMYALVYIAAR